MQLSIHFSVIYTEHLLLVNQTLHINRNKTQNYTSTQYVIKFHQNAEHIHTHSIFTAIFQVNLG